MQINKSRQTQKQKNKKQKTKKTKKSCIFFCSKYIIPKFKFDIIKYKI